MKDDGGPAFPNEYTMSTNNGGVVSPVNPVFGLTVRDWFAAQCLMGMCCTMEMVAKMDAPERAKYAYLNADAMLKERAKP